MITQEDTLHLMDVVSEMRALQKEYFRTRNSEVMQRAKQSERKVDQLLEEMRLKITGKNEPNLFGG